MSCVLYYSNYCGFSKNILTKLSRSNIKSDIHFLCIDKRVVNNNKTYIILENGDRVLLHPDVTKVPALMLLNKNNEILFGEDIHKHFEYQIRRKEVKTQVDPRTDKVEPESFSLNDLMGSVKSDNFSFIDMSAEDLSAKGNGGVRLMYNYSGLNDQQKIYTPEEDYKPNKVDENEVKKYQEQRAAAVPMQRGAPVGN
tara:strand:+ start:11034 stop:11624 length:591 start_codon:yes stop_codon:yes gene_type:complete